MDCTHCYSILNLIVGIDMKQFIIVPGEILDTLQIICNDFVTSTGTQNVSASPVMDL